MAELKRRSREQTGHSLHGFHGVTTVAELKQRGRVFQRLVERGFPRRHNRGRIEATSTRRIYTRHAQRFHGVTTVAELKQRLSDRRRVDNNSFHGVTTVAELKRGNHEHAPSCSRGFHGVTTVAELKPYSPK